jgi:hypothetical protein
MLSIYCHSDSAVYSIPCQFLAHFPCHNIILLHKQCFPPYLLANKQQETATCDKCVHQGTALSIFFYSVTKNSTSCTHA